jgi:hypothetical protein
MMRRVLVVVILAAAAPVVAAGQGTLSTQGFGYPVGGLSTRALAAGGASGELDPRSSRNPAAVRGWQRAGLYVQYDPELRTVTRGDFADRTVTPRFSAAMLAFPVRTRGILALSTHSFLDRTWTTEIRSGQRLGPDSVGYLERVSSSGAINDTRVSYAHGGPRFSVGVGLHFFTGENRISLRREFDDSLRYRTLSRSLTLAYAGRGYSAGVMAQPARWLSLGTSYRKGGKLELRVIDTLRTSADVPDRFGLSVKADPVPGLSVLASADRTRWSGLNGLGSATARGVDTWEYGVGAEFSGQRTRNANWVYSAGYRTRDLPFQAAGALVSERLLTAGLGVPIAGPRATVDFAVQRAKRSAAGAARENAWLLSAGLTIRP